MANKLLSFSDEHLQVINDALQLAPLGKAYPVIMEINRQLQTVHDAAADARSEPVPLDHHPV